MIYKVNNNTIKKVVTIVEYIEVVFNIIILLGLTVFYKIYTYNSLPIFNLKIVRH